MFGNVEYPAIDEKFQALRSSCELAAGVRSISKHILYYNGKKGKTVTLNQKEPEMGQKIHFNASAQLYENECGDLAIRFANNLVFEAVGIHSEKSFVTEAIELMRRGERPPGWRMIPYRKLLHGRHHWHLVSSLGFLDGDETKPAVGLDVKPEELGR